MVSTSWMLYVDVLRFIQIRMKIHKHVQSNGNGSECLQWLFAAESQSDAVMFSLSNLKNVDKQTVPTFGDVITIETVSVHFNTHAFAARIHSYVFSIHRVCRSAVGTANARTKTLFIHSIYRITPNSIDIILLFCRLILFVLWFSRSVLVQILFRQRWIHNVSLVLVQNFVLCYRLHILFCRTIRLSLKLWITVTKVLYQNFDFDRWSFF